MTLLGFLKLDTRFLSPSSRLSAQVHLMALLEAAVDWRRGAAPSTAARPFAGADLASRSSACAAGSMRDEQHSRAATGAARSCADACASLGAGCAPTGQPRARRPGARSGAACRESMQLAGDLAATELVPRSGWYRVGPGGVPPPALAEAARLALLPRAAARRFLQRARRCAWSRAQPWTTCDCTELWKAPLSFVMLFGLASVLLRRCFVGATAAASSCGLARLCVVGEE